SGDGGRDVPGAGPARDRDLDRHLVRSAVAFRLRVGRVPGHRWALPLVGAPDAARRAVHLLGKHRTVVPDRDLAPIEHPPAPGGDRGPVPDAQRSRRVTRIAVVGAGAWGT